ncbi:MAG: VWA domain-containing protein [Spirochaetia bacterium]|jgi:Ca-activated chloride channel family protein|nr:VWA domain-containing protein [Spirochaetales bacterium]MDX9784602.1 VWA domain-containing protein [Spirochaetia bacterium]
MPDQRSSKCNQKSNPTLRFFWLLAFCCLLLAIIAGCATKDKTNNLLPPSSPETGISGAQYSVAPGAQMSMAFASSAKAGGYIPEPPPSYSGQYASDFNTEEYDRIVDNPFLKALDNPVSTFSIDVDTASYSNLRRYLMEYYEMPPKDAVRIEEMLNYFEYGYPAAASEHPVNANFALSPAPWNSEHLLLRVALAAKTIPTDNLPASNLVFLIDSSGSMYDDNKLPLLKRSMRIMAEQLRPLDKVSIVAYAGSAGLVLESTPGGKKEKILAAFDSLEAGGSTAGGEGIQLAYRIAKENFITGGNNRVILCTDGDFNVGVSSTSELERLIEEKRKDNIYLTVLGFGVGNYKDSRMETLADKGNGNYAYIDTLMEGNKVLGKEIWGNLFAVAKDVKIQIEFNPGAVREYRLIGYENRMLAREDFNDDTKDAGEMGSGQTVTAFYELVPPGAPSTNTVSPDPLVFQDTNLVPSEDLAVFRLRYKEPADGTEESRLVETRLNAKSLTKPLAESDEDFRFASAVAEFGMLLRDSPHKGAASWAAVLQRARQSKGNDEEGYRSEFIRLVEMAEIVARSTK